MKNILFSCYKSHLSRFRFSTHQFSKLEIINSSLTDIYYNLAAEEYLYEHYLVDHPILFLWRNDKTVVIGRHQNPHKECHLQVMEEDNVKLSRRRSGGGAVYHNLGNTCFSFITPVYGDSPPLNAKTKNNEILLRSLEKLGIKSEVSGRNDILCDGKKISGSAYQVSLGKKDGTGKKCLHHGTMLINIDPTIISKYLNPNKEKLKSKGVDSVISRVTNLIKYDKEMTHEKLCNSISESFEVIYGNKPCTISLINEEFFEKNQKLNSILKELRSQEWLYQNTPKFTNNLETRFDWGVIDVYLQVEENRIIKGKVYSDCLYPEFIEHLNILINKGEFHYNRQGIKKLCDEMRNDLHSNEKYEEFSSQIEQWLIKSI